MNNNLTLEEILLVDRDFFEANELLRNFYKWDIKSLNAVAVRSLSLPVQIEIFKYWEIPYHIDRKNSYHIDDVDSVLLELNGKSTWELSLSIKGEYEMSIKFIGNKLVVVKDNSLHVLLKKCWKDAV